MIDGIKNLTIDYAVLKEPTKEEQEAQAKKENKPEGFVWDAMLTKYEDSHNPLRQEMIHDLRQLTIQANHLNPLMAHIITMLQHAGHHLTILSNMGMKILDTQIQDIKQADLSIPEDELKTTLHFLENRNHSIIASSKNNWLHKPTCLSPHE